MSFDPPTPTRASKKERTRERILANAIALFRGQGIRPTKLSEVAARSDISPATLFNYFPTKGRLAEAWVRGEAETALARVIADSLDRDRSLRSAIRMVCRELAAASAPEVALRLEAWQETGRAAARATLRAKPKGATLAAGLREEQKRERVRADVSAVDLAEILMDAIEGGLIAGLRAETESSVRNANVASIESDLFQSIRSRVDLALDGSRKRNERVSTPSARIPAVRPITRLEPDT